MQAKLYARRANVLGEGPLWDDRSGRLYWVDIRSRVVEWIDHVGGRAGRRELSARVSALGLRRENGLIAAADRMIGVLRPERGEFEPRIVLEEEPVYNRTNDGSVGGDGRFWFGVMSDAGEIEKGALYSVSSDWTLTRALDKISIPNGLLTDRSGARLHATDSARGLMQIYAIDAASGGLTHLSMLAAFNPEAGTPDGAAMDEEGCVWTALWDGAAVVRVRPDRQIDYRVALPVARPTSCAFGGADLRTLYITSARDGLSASSLAAQPLSGSVFEVATPMRGLPTSVFCG